MYNNLIQVLTELTEFFLSPLLGVFSALGLDLSLIPIKIGFGSVTWFDIPLDDLLTIIITVFIWFTAYRILWRYISKLFPRLPKKRV